jgi:ribosomal protein L4
MIREINLKDSSLKNTSLKINDKFLNISSKIISLAVNKSHSHKQGNNHSKDRSEIAGSSKKLFKQKGTRKKIK